MDPLKHKASVQYGDYKGWAEFDGHNGPMLHRLFEDKGLDKDYFPIGFQLYEENLREIPFSNEADLTVFAVKKDEVGNNFDEVEKHIKNNDGQLKVTKINLALSYSELSAYFKRMGLFVIQNGLENAIKDLKEEGSEDY